ncbi:MAG: succinate dehydrogenase cytochrome b subunit [Polyangia bacterium]|jgi:succinate dehydrogenase / fumarate reductase cytochrome b subunit|nr:succinate dehydrogenase cytochrome b subunit [Polyangia bacterium]
MAIAVMRFWSTSVGKKMVMAVSGVVVFGFVLGHMLGNLQIYAGPEKLNAYAAFLQGNKALLWAVRLTMLTAVILHVLSAAQLWLQGRRARPVAYHRQELVVTTYAARTMVIGGPIIAAFVIYHLLHLTTGHAHASFVPGDVYSNVIAGFQVWWISAFYILGNLMVGLHLYHGVWSMLQTLGASHPRFDPWRKRGAIAFALAVTIGNVSFPVSVLTGLVP